MPNETVTKSFCVARRNPVAVSQSSLSTQPSGGLRLNASPKAGQSNLSKPLPTSIYPCSVVSSNSSIINQRGTENAIKLALDKQKSFQKRTLMDYWLLPRGVIGYPFVVRSKEKLQLRFLHSRTIHFELNRFYHVNGALVMAA